MPLCNSTDSNHFGVYRHLIDNSAFVVSTRNDLEISSMANTRIIKGLLESIMQCEGSFFYLLAMCTHQPILRGRAWPKHPKKPSPFYIISAAVSARISKMTKLEISEFSFLQKTFTFRI